MKNKLLLLFALCLLFTGCAKEDPALKAATKRTVVAYLFDDINLWDYLLESVNLMETGLDPDTDGTLLVYLDASPHITQFGSPVLLEIEHDTTDAIVSRVVKTYPDQDASDPKVFATVLKETTELYPADSYGLIVGGHGYGWVTANEKHARAIGSSDRFGTPSLDIDDLAEALPVHYDFIVFHACLMGEAATLYQLRDKTDYVVASVESLPGYGYPYHQNISTLFTQPYADLYKFARLSQQAYQTEANPATFAYMTVGTYRMAQMEALADQVNRALTMLNMTYSDMMQYCQGIVNRPELHGFLAYPYPEVAGGAEDLLFFDFMLLHALVDDKDPAMAKSLLKAINNVVIQKYIQGGVLNVQLYSTLSHGLSFYIPYPTSVAPKVAAFNQAFYTRFAWSAASGFTSKWE